MLPQYFVWHYGRGLKAAFGLAHNAIEAALHIWSVRELFATLFEPWRMIVVPHRREEALSSFFSAVWYNLLSRLIGAVARVIAIALGVATTLVMGFVGAGIVGFWLIGPALPPIFILLAFAILA